MAILHLDLGGEFIMSDIITEIGIWVAAAYTLMVYSYPFKDTPLFRIAEHTMIGLGVAIYTVMGIKNILDIAVGSIITRGEALWFIPIILGLLLFTRYSSNYAWLSRWPLSLLVGVGVGVAMGSIVDSYITSQIRSTIVDVTNINGALLLIMLVLSLTYFIFSIGLEQRERGILKYTAQLGRYILMIYFGAVYGNTVMTRMALLIGRLRFLLFDWLKLG